MKTDDRLAIQMDATTIAAATVPIWMPLRPTADSSRLLDLHEFICLEQLVNAIVLVDEIVVPNYAALEDDSFFARRYLL